MKILIETSARHIHLSDKDLQALFGKDYVLTKLKDLSQPGQFACKEKVKMKTKLGSIFLRILAPSRKNTQIEISKTEARKVGLNPPVRSSGNIEKSEKVVIIGPKGTVRLKRGVIIAKRHIHASNKEAQKYKLKNKQIVSVKTKGIRSITFHNVIVRVHDKFALRMHIDTDEANAAFIKENNIGEIIKS